MSGSNRIKSEECSQIGLLLLAVMDNNKLTFEQLANAMDISKAALRISCHKQGNPGQRIIPKLAVILDCTEGKIRRMIRENQLKQMHEQN